MSGDELVTRTVRIYSGCAIGESVVAATPLAAASNEDASECTRPFCVRNPEAQRSRWTLYSETAAAETYAGS